MRAKLRLLRNPRTIWVACLVALIAVPLVYANGSPTEAVDFAQAGHWVYNEVQKAIFHVHGGSKRVDATVPVEGVTQGGQVVQGTDQGYLVDGGQAVVFGKADLRVEAPIQLPGGEEPVGLEVPGGPYLVYRQLGIVVRLGLPAVTLQIGSPVRSAIATRDGIVWVQRVDSNQLCRLTKGSSGFQCDGRHRASERGTLAAVGRKAAFVDPVAGTVAAVDETGIAAPITVMTPLPDGGQVAAADSGGRLAVLDTTHHKLILADTSWAERSGPQKATTSLEVALEAGQYSPPVATDGSVVLLDRTRSQVLTFQRDGHRRTTVKVPAPADSTRIAAGGDGRVYVDDARGEHTLVVDADGSVTQVAITGDVPGASPSAKPSVSPSVVAPGQSLKPVQPPGAPRGLRAQPGNGRVVLAWSPASNNGAPLTGYEISWTGNGGQTGSAAARGNARTATVSGLENGVAYTFRVAARNRGGLGPAATAGPVVPSSEVPSAPGKPTAAAKPDGTITVSWPAANGQGHMIATYQMTAAGADGSSIPFAPSGGTAATVGTGDGLVLGVAYTFTVVAANDLGFTSEPSAASDAAAPFGPALAPAGLTAIGSDGTIALTWSTPDLRGGDLVDYVVSATGLGTRTLTGTSTSFTGLTNGQSHTFTVHAVTRGKTGGGTVDGAAATATASAGRPPSVTLNSATLTGDRYVTVHVTVDDHNSGPVTCQVLLNGAERWRGGCGTQDIGIGGLAYSTDYVAQVQVSNAYGIGPISGTLGFRTNNPPPSVTVSKGARHTVSGCSSAACAWVNVAARNLAPSTSYKITCYSGWAPDPGPYWSINRTTDGAGSLDLINDANMCVFGYGGSTVWVTVGSYESNHLVW